MCVGGSSKGAVEESLKKGKGPAKGMTKVRTGLHSGNLFYELIVA